MTFPRYQIKKVEAANNKKKNKIHKVLISTFQLSKRSKPKLQVLISFKRNLMKIKTEEINLPLNLGNFHHSQPIH